MTLRARSFAVDDDEQSSDSNSPKFDGFRHYRERKNAGTPGAQARTQFVAANEDNMVFGYGRHACPGRFFAANEIKMILARLLLDYDIGMPGGMMQRYKQVADGDFVNPDPTKEIVLTKIRA